MRATAIGAKVASSTTTKTLIQLLAATNHPIRITEIGISFEGDNNLAKPVLVEFLIQTTAGTASSLTPVKITQSHSGTIATSAQETFTAEPTASDIMKLWTVHPQGVPWVYSVPDPPAFEIPGGSRVGLRTTLASGESNVDGYPYIEWDE